MMASHAPLNAMRSHEQAGVTSLHESVGPSMFAKAALDRLGSPEQLHSSETGEDDVSEEDDLLAVNVLIDWLSALLAITSQDPHWLKSRFPSTSLRTEWPHLSGKATQRCDPPNAHATISGNSSRQNVPPCAPLRSCITTSAPASRSAFAHFLAFPRKNGSSVPATR
jgi:hypothetical protein